MDAPKRVSGELFNAMIDEWLTTHAYQVGIDGAAAPTEEAQPLYACLACNTPIKWHRAYMSIHESNWSTCAGYGECINPTIPICPKCEPNPDVFGCIHLGVTSDPDPDPVPDTPALFRLFAWILEKVGIFNA